MTKPVEIGVAMKLTVLGWDHTTYWPILSVTWIGWKATAMHHVQSKMNSTIRATNNRKHSLYNNRQIRLGLGIGLVLRIVERYIKYPPLQWLWLLALIRVHSQGMERKKKLTWTLLTAHPKSKTVGHLKCVALTWDAFGNIATTFSLEGGL